MFHNVQCSTQSFIVCRFTSEKKLGIFLFNVERPVYGFPYFTMGIRLQRKRRTFVWRRGRRVNTVIQHTEVLHIRFIWNTILYAAFAGTRVTRRKQYNITRLQDVLAEVLTFCACIYFDFDANVLFLGSVVPQHVPHSHRLPIQINRKRICDQFDCYLSIENRNLVSCEEFQSENFQNSSCD